MLVRRDVTFLPHVFYGSTKVDVRTLQRAVTPSVLSPFAEEEEEEDDISAATRPVSSPIVTIPPQDHKGEHRSEEFKYADERGDDPVPLETEEENNNVFPNPLVPQKEEEEETDLEEPAIPARRSTRTAVRTFRGTSHEIEAQTRADAANKKRKEKTKTNVPETALLNHLISSALQTAADEDDNPTYRQAKKGPEKHFWEQSFTEEITAQEANGTWEVGTPPEGVDIIGSRWVLRRKRDRAGNISRWKSRIVALGYQQVKGVHFHETYSPTLKFQTLRFMMAFIVFKKWTMKQLDVTTAFLIPKLPEDEIIWMEAPPGVRVEPGQALRLLRTLYGLSQASRSFNKHIDANLRNIGLEPASADACLYTFKIEGRLVAILGLYVDDCLMGGEPEVCKKLVDALTAIYNMTVEDKPEFMLGIAIDHDIKAGTLRLSQEAYCNRMLETYNMTDCKPVKTPAAVERLTAGVGEISKEEAEAMKKVPYRNAVGALLFLMLCTRPDLAFATIQSAKFVEDPRPSHWQAIKRIFRYIKGTANYGITYYATEKFLLEGWSDSDWGGDLDTRRSTSGYLMTLASKFGYSALSWRCKLQRLIAMSSCEAELISLVEATKETLWCWKIMTDFGFVDIIPIRMYEDNQGCMAIANNQRGMSSRTKHVETRYFSVRQHVDNGTIVVIYMETSNMLADILTKAAGATIFSYIRDRMGIGPP